MKPGLCVDFDGVIHSYASKWTNPTTIPDPPVEGALEWLWKMQEHFTVWVLSSRSDATGGIEAMHAWMVEHAVDSGFLEGHPMREPLLHKYPINFATAKPPALLYVDDRGYRFAGPQSFRELTAEFIKAARVWNDGLQRERRSQGTD